MRGRNEKGLQVFRQKRNLNRRDHLGDLEVDGMVIFSPNIMVEWLRTCFAFGRS